MHTISVIVCESGFSYFSAGPACCGNQYPPLGVFFMLGGYLKSCSFLFFYLK